MIIPDFKQEACFKTGTRRRAQAENNVLNKFEETEMGVQGD